MINLTVLEIKEDKERYYQRIDKKLAELESLKPIPRTLEKRKFLMSDIGHIEKLIQIANLGFEHCEDSY